MLNYNIKITDKHVSYSWVGDEFTNKYYAKIAKLQAQGIAYTASVEYMEYEVEIEYDFYENIQPAEIFVPEEMMEYMDDEWDDDDYEDNSEIHYFATAEEAKECVASEVKDFRELDTIRGMNIIVRNCDTKQVVFHWNKVKELA